MIRKDHSSLLHAWMIEISFYRCRLSQLFIIVNERPEVSNPFLRHIVKTCKFSLYEAKKILC